MLHASVNIMQVQSSLTGHATGLVTTSVYVRAILSVCKHDSLAFWVNSEKTL